ncbi:MAG TPA: gfo/Idh/MocA family oxidoreductase, partial [Clostridia bacterium]|nr:gfo/Idh/MocA family oxidoreductase [Clostridia bacterium]
RQTRVATHFQPASDGQGLGPIFKWLEAGAIGTLREIHNWSSRPVWPQYPTLPTDRPPVPPDFDWQLWLGPSLDRPYHPHYTHALFRGWYEFGGGALADMGHYSLWPIFQHFNLDAPYCVESTPSHLCTLKANTAVRIRNDYSFPAACTIRFRFAAKGNRPALDLFWYDGSMKPPTPDELLADNKELEAEGMLLVGDKGKILGTFHGDNARLLSGGKVIPAESAENTSRSSRRSSSWIAAFKGGPPTYGDFLLAGPISDAFNLGAVSLRLGKRLLFDSTAGKVTNLPEANKLLTREYREGWAL